jgi:bifunctional DNA-binding transcriptional regulator/antitoxin component of YhaV-PrlF toxin-antitoxin module
MMILHDKLKKMGSSTLTERGQISVPAFLRRSMKLQPGQTFRWQRISEREIRVSIETSSKAGPLSVLGYAQKLLKRPARRTASWMQELRAGEK